jgi:hypothetical protein
MSPFALVTLEAFFIQKGNTMRNDYQVHILRDAIIKSRPEHNCEPSWLLGFKQSFVRDFADVKKAKQQGSFNPENANRATSKQYEKAFDFGFEAGMILKKAIEVWQDDSESYGSNRTENDPNS